MGQARWWWVQNVLELGRVSGGVSVKSLMSEQRDCGDVQLKDPVVGV